MQTATANSQPRPMSEAEINRRLLSVYRVLGVFDDAQDRSEAQSAEASAEAQDDTAGRGAA